MENDKVNETVNWQDKTEIELLHRVYDYACNGLRYGKSTYAREWLKEKKLTIDITMACFNSGQLHHRKEKEFREALERIGFMKKSPYGKTDHAAPYTVFGNFSVMFPLRNEKNEVVNFYAVGLKNNKTAHMNLAGIYPGYPHEQTRRLFVVDNVLDAAVMMESKVMDNREAVIALYDGIFLDQHVQTIKGLKHLTEVIQIKSKQHA